MVNWNSIVSSFNAKGTLLKWIKNVDEQLEQGQLESVTVADETSTTFCLLFTFADGTTIKTDAITKLAGADGQDGQDGQSQYWHVAAIDGIKGKNVIGQLDDSVTMQLYMVYPSLSNEAATTFAEVQAKSIWNMYLAGYVSLTKTGDNSGTYGGWVFGVLDVTLGEINGVLYKSGSATRGFSANNSIVTYHGAVDFSNVTVLDYVAGVE